MMLFNIRIYMYSRRYRTPLPKPANFPALHFYKGMHAAYLRVLSGFVSFFYDARHKIDRVREKCNGSVKAVAAKLYYRMLRSKDMEELRRLFQQFPDSVKSYLNGSEEELAKHFPIACGDLHGRHFSSPVEGMNAADIRNGVRGSEPYAALNNELKADSRRILSYKAESEKLKDEGEIVCPNVKKELEEILTVAVSKRARIEFIDRFKKRARVFSTVERRDFFVTELFDGPDDTGAYARCSCGLRKDHGLCRHLVWHIMKAGQGWTKEDFAHERTRVSTWFEQYCDVDYPIPPTEGLPDSSLQFPSLKPLQRGRPAANRRRPQWSELLETADATCSTCGEKGHKYYQCLFLDSTRVD